MSLCSNIGPIVSSSDHFKSVLRGFSDQLKILHFNCQSIRPSLINCKFDELKNIIGCDFDLIGVTETWLKPNVSSKSISISGYKLIRNDRLYARAGGIAIYISDQIKFKIISKVSLNGCESIFIQLSLYDNTVLFGVVYLPHGDLNLFESTHYELLSTYKDIIIAGDFNCNMFDDLKASRMRNMCLRCNLCVSHKSKPTHFDLVHGTTSLLDIWLVSDTSCIFFSDQVYCPSISHHAFIFAAFRIEVCHNYKFIEYRDYNRIDWDGLFFTISSFDYDSYFRTGDVDAQNHLISSLIESLYEFVPIVRRRIKNNDSSWMKCNEIRLAISLRDMAFSFFKRSNSPENWLLYCKYRNRAKSVIRKVRKKYYCKLFSGLDSSEMWKILKGHGVNDDNEISLDCDVNEVNRYFVNAGSFIASTDDIFDFNSLSSNNNFSFHCVNDVEIYNAMYLIKSKCIGTDGIPIRFLKTIYHYISDIILHHINYILTSSTYPSAWKTARVVPIPKSRVVRGVQDLRPISILPSLSKIVEHIMKNQMLAFVHNRISPSQFAFRRGHSTTSLLLSLTDDIRHSLNNGNYTAMVSLDLAKAFNSVNFYILIKKLRYLFQFSEPACRLIFSYLCDRSQFVDINGMYSNILHLFSGVPQGSVLGPLLFILYINDLPNIINTGICKSFIFADDVMLLVRTGLDNSDVLQSNINFYIDRFLEWCSDNYLTVNASKTKAILFGNVNLPSLSIVVNGININLVDKLECLGIHIDKRLTFDYHIDRLSSKVVGILRRLYSIGIFLPCRTRYILAFSLLMTHVLYGLEVVSGTVSYNIDRLRRITNMIVRFVYNIRRRMHISEYVKTFLGTSFLNFVSYRNIILFFKTIKIGLPVWLRSEFTFSHSSRNPQIIIPRIRISLFERSFIVRVARFWNTLPLELRIFSQSNNVFRLKLMRHLSNI